MKMTPAHFTQLETMIKSANPDLNMTDHLESLRTIGFSEKRIRWDILFDVPYANRVTWFDEVYKYLNDDHIDTALKAVLKRIG